MTYMRAFPAAALIVTMVSPAVRAQMLEKTGTFGGLKLTYKVALPAQYDPARAYPAVLVFTGGPQTLPMAGSTIESDWGAEAARRGYIIIGPGTPNGELFFEGADRVFPEFLEAIRRDYKVQGKLHIAGHSNGGLSAFHVAAKYPQYFSTLTGYPGLLDGLDLSFMQSLKPMCIFMHVGDRDSGWVPAMVEQAERMKRIGFRVKISIEENQVHRLKAYEIDLQARLLDEIESCR